MQTTSVATDATLADLTVIVPTLNEANALPRLLTELAERYPGARVIVADDDSRDGTREAAAAFQGPLHVRVLHRNGGSVKGLTASVVDAIKLVDTRVFVVMDADSQHPATAVAGLHRVAANGADLAVGCRSNYEHFSAPRLAFSKGARALTRRYLNSRGSPLVDDPMSGFFGGKTAFAQAIVKAHEHDFEKTGFKVLVDLLRFAPLEARVEEVPYRMGTRAADASKLKVRHFVSLLRQLGPVGKVLGFALLSFTSPTFWKFATVGLSGVLVNQALLYTAHGLLALPLLIASPLAIEGAIAWNFLWNDKWSFRGKARHLKWAHRFLRFNSHCAVSAFLNAGILWGLVHFTGAHYLLANLGGIAAAMTFNWGLSQAWTWRERVDA